jgi:hypothetical protein
MNTFKSQIPILTKYVLIKKLSEKKPNTLNKKI